MAALNKQGAIGRSWHIMWFPYLLNISSQHTNFPNIILDSSFTKIGHEIYEIVDKIGHEMVESGKISNERVAGLEVGKRSTEENVGRRWRSEIECAIQWLKQ